MLLVVIETSFELVIPVLMSDIIDQGVARGDVGCILRIGVEMSLCALLALVTGLLYARYAARASYGFGARIRGAEYAKVQQYAFGNLDHFETSSLITPDDHRRHRAAERHQRRLPPPGAGALPCWCWASSCPL